MKKTLTSIFLAAVLLLGMLPASGVLAAEPFEARVLVTADAAQFEGRQTFVTAFQVKAGTAGQELFRNQNLSLVYDNSKLQLIRWDGASAFGDSTFSAEFNNVPGAANMPAVGQLEGAASRFQAAKPASGEEIYLSLEPSFEGEPFVCGTGYLTLQQIRFALRPGVAADDLTQDSIRLMEVSELAVLDSIIAVRTATTQHIYGSQQGEADTLGRPTVESPFKAGQNPNPTPTPIAGTPGNPQNPIPTPIPNNPVIKPNPPTGIDDVTVPPSGYQNPFSDVVKGAWYYDSVMFVYSNGLMTGTNDSPMLFSPNLPTTRGMIVTILYRLNGVPDVVDLPNPFDDVPAGAWYADAVKWAAENNIVSGYGGGKFGPMDNITREQLATILSNFANFAKMTFPVVHEYTGFADEASISDFAEDAVERLFIAGIVGGKPDNNFDPRGSATRAEVSSMLTRLIIAARA